MSLLDQLKQKRLKPTETIVRSRDGSRYVERISEKVTQKLEKDPDDRFFEMSESGKYNYNAWCHDGGKWKMLGGIQMHKKSEGKTFPSRFGIATYNVWFSKTDFQKRFKALMARLKKIQKDNGLEIICLQEVTAEFIQLLKEEEWLQNEYYCSDMSGYKSVTPYGVLILVHHSLPLSCFYSHLLPSNMGRKLMVAEFVDLNYKDKLWRVGTVHLESEQCWEIRKIQFTGNIVPILNENSCSNQILVGDFNINGFSDEQNMLDQNAPHLLDCWRHLNPLDQNSCTMVEFPVRIDRILVHKACFSPISIERIGFFPVLVGKNSGNELLPGETTDEDHIHPSDHCGLYAVVVVKQ
eukprot:TRINITY_DN19743_c0_g1_i1.p1 TRINITY_DN19743_c0_g1~~TRINITY_DN19743_c0_g1_i1.p1  ORF type:complete len:352 (-),score=63.53 TRINITY_DN19743_c0_g1_i1:198-1253(-)